MKIRDISSIVFAGAASLWMAASAGAAPLQQDLTIPIRPTRPSPEDDAPEEGSQTRPEAPDQTVIRPGAGRLPIKPFQTPSDLAPQSDQRVVVNSQFAGWESASDALDGKRIGETLRGNWIMVDATGRFDGRVIAGKNAEFTNMNVFLMHMGRLVKQTTVDEEGRFVFNNVRQGAYALTGWGERGLFTFGVNILANNPNLVDNIPPNSVTATAYQNQTTINTDWIAHYSPQVGFRVFGRYSEGEGANNSPALYGSLGLYNNAPESEPATSISSHVVSRTSDGRLVGRVHQLNSLSGRPIDLRSTKILLLENDSVVAATSADNFGVFEFQEVPNGSYGVLGAGVDGLGLIGITVGDEAPETNTIDFTLIPVETVGWLHDYATEVAYRRNIAAPRRPAPQDNPQNNCQNCQDRAGGCAECRRRYLESVCSQQGLTFEQWQATGCQAMPSGFGQGRFVREVGNSLRNSIDRLDRFSENTFYPNEATNNVLQSLGQGGSSPAPSIQGNGFNGGSSTRPSFNGGSSTRPSAGGSSTR